MYAYALHIDLFKYSEILLNAVKRNKKLKIYNNLDFDEIFSNNIKTINTACSFFRSLRLGEEVNTNAPNIKKKLWICKMLYIYCFI